MRVARAVFGAHGQIVVGAVMLALTIGETSYWTIWARPTFMPIFLVSMEALAFAAFNQIGNGLGYRATERVEKVVADNIENVEADTVIET